MLEGYKSKARLLEEISQLRSERDQLRAKEEERLHLLSVKDVAKFPEENPNPVLRVSVDGALIYANSSSLKLLQLLGWKV